ncbi:MAG: Ig-like domain-containing protein [Erysipelotrichales bacterium]|nr:Ig-like domain-containing protein [Erysipelotrichales bacterium]
MKKSKLLILSAALFALVGCQNGNSTNSEQPSLPSVGGTSTGTSQSVPGTSQGNSTSTPSITQSAARALFKTALSKDYSNLTLISYQQYEDGEYSETDYEYIDNGYIVNESYDLIESGYDRKDASAIYHIDDEGKSWMYWEAESNNPASKSGWINKGASNSDLSIWRAYFHLPKILENITEDDVTYTGGMYYVTSRDKIEELNMDAFGYAIYNDIISISFSLSNGYISRIIGYCDNNMSNPLNYVEIQLGYFGETVLPSYFGDVLPFSEETKMAYWEYKGWPQDYQRAYYTNAETEILTDNLESDDDHDVIIDVDKKFEVRYSLTPNSFNPWELVDEADKVVTWHYDSSILEMKNSYKSNTREFRGIADGVCEVYVSVNGENGPVESEHIIVKVNGLKEQDKTGAVYGFKWLGLEAQGEGANVYYNVLATNEVEGSNALFEITAGPGVWMNDGRNAESNYFVSGQQYMHLQPSSNNVMNKTRGADIFFDFGEQQVSKISFNYGTFWASHLNEMSWLNSFVIRTYNDGEDAHEVDIASVIKANISAEFVKNFELEFEPANHVEIVAKSNMLGKNMSIAIDSIYFMANEDCSNYVPPSDRVAVESVAVVPNSVDSIYVDGTVQLSASVLPQNATDKSVTWHVEDESVASVNNGLVTGLSAGTTEVWAVSNDNDEISSNKVSVTVKELPNMEAYEGNKYTGNVAFEVLDKHTAKATYSGCDVTASITGIDGEFLVFGDSENGFKASFSNSRVTVKEFVYNGENKMSSKPSGYDADLLVRLTSFTLSFNSSSSYTDRVDSEKTYDVQVGDTKYMYIYTNDNASFDVSYESTDDSKVDMNSGVGGSRHFVSVKFVESGDVTVTVTLKDNYGTEKSIDAKFSIATKVFPTEDNWEIKYNKDLTAVKVGNQVQFSVEWKDNNTINTDKTVTWSVSDTKLASISNASDSKGLLTAKEVGEVTVTASVKGENNTPITKTVTFTISAAEEGTLPDAIVGVWEGEDDNYTSYTLTINADGTAVIENDDVEYHFTFKEIKGGNEYIFTCDDAGDDGVYIGVRATNSDIEFYDEHSSGFWMDDYFMIYSDSPLDIKKR